jgi:hypothetical protein
MPSGVRLDIGGEDRAKGLVEALNRKIDETTAKLKTVATQSAVTEREGKKLWEQTRTPLEKYNIALDRSKQLLDQGKISHETYRRSVERAKQAMDQQGASGVQWAAQLAARYGGVTSVLAGVAAAFRGVAAAQAEAEGKVRAAAPGLAGLAQLAGGDRAEYRRLIGQATSIYKAGAAPDQNAAANLLFTLRSAGVGPAEMRFFQQAASSQAFGDTAGLAISAQALQSSLGASAGTKQQLISAALGAGRFATTDVASLMSAASKGGGGAAALGISGPELMGALSIVQRGTGPAEPAGTAMAALLRDVSNRPGFQGLGMVGIVERLQANPQLQKSLSDEGLGAYRRLAGRMPDVKRAIGEAQRGQAADLAAATARLPSQVPEVAAAIDMQRQAARAERAATEFGVEGLRVQAGIAAAQARLEGGGRVGAFRRWMAGRFGQLEYAVTGDPEAAVTAAAQWTDPTFGAGPGGQARTEALLRDIKGNTARAASGKVPMPEY